LGPTGGWRNVVLNKVLPNFRTNDFNKFYSPIDMGSIYGKSKIVFNASIREDLNMRFFEALASGALLVTDRIPEAVGDLFEENVDFIACGI
jgi:hypothetical protein